MDIRRLTRYVPRWSDVEKDKQVGDGELAREFFLLPRQTARMQLADRCQAASQGDTSIHYALVKAGRYFRCFGRAAPGGLYCRIHLAIARRRAAARGREV